MSAEHILPQNVIVIHPVVIIILLLNKQMPGEKITSLPEVIKQKHNINENNRWHNVHIMMPSKLQGKQCVAKFVRSHKGETLLVCSYKQNSQDIFIYIFHNTAEGSLGSNVHRSKVFAPAQRSSSAGSRGVAGSRVQQCGSVGWRFPVSQETSSSKAPHRI